MLGSDKDANRALDTLSGLAFVQATAEGLVLHNAVQRRRRATRWWTRTGSASTAPLPGITSRMRRAPRLVMSFARFTADLLFLIDNPVVREAMFPRRRTSTASSRPVRTTPRVSGPSGSDESAEAAAVLDLWLERAPATVRAVRNRQAPSRAA